MSPLRGSNPRVPGFRRANDDVVKQVATLLRESGWEQRVRRVAGVQPDLLAWNPQGIPFVFEVKTGRGQGHLGAVAQVEAYRNAISKELGQNVHAVLLVATSAPAQLDEVARSADVLLLRATDVDATAIRKALRSLTS